VRSDLDTVVFLWSRAKRAQFEWKLGLREFPPMWRAGLADFEPAVSASTAAEVAAGLPAPWGQRLGWLYALGQASDGLFAVAEASRERVPAPPRRKGATWERTWAELAREGDASRREAWWSALGQASRKHDAAAIQALGAFFDAWAPLSAVDSAGLASAQAFVDRTEEAWREVGRFVRGQVLGVVGRSPSGAELWASTELPLLGLAFPSAGHGTCVSRLTDEGRWLAGVSTLLPTADGSPEPQVDDSGGEGAPSLSFGHRAFTGLAGLRRAFWAAGGVAAEAALSLDISLQQRRAWQHGAAGIAPALFALLALEPHMLTWLGAGALSADQRRALRWHRLQWVRGIAARTLALGALRELGPGAAGLDLARQHLRRAHLPEDALWLAWSLDELLEAGAQLEHIVCAVGAAEALVERWDDQWVRHPGARAALASHWSLGSARCHEDLLRALGAQRPSTDALCGWALAGL
jgi:hypothetical protein